MRAEQVPQGVGVPNASGHNASSAIPPRAVGMAKMVPLGPCPNRLLQTAREVEPLGEEERLPECVC